MSSNECKKKSFISRLFSSGSSVRNDDDKEGAKKRLQRLHSVDVTTFREKNSTDLFTKDAKPVTKKNDLKPVKEEGDKLRRKQSVPVSSPAPRTELKSNRNQKKSASASASGNQKRIRRRKKTTLTGIKVDMSKPLEYPATPEMIYEYHKHKPFLDKNEEWLVIELNEYECLVESLEVIKIIAKHSKFFEVEPDELWEEFFEFMEEVPTYDEIINYDVWQEFRDNKYPC